MAPSHEFRAQVVTHGLLDCGELVAACDDAADAGCGINLKGKTFEKVSFVAVDICRPAKYVEKAFVELLLAIHEDRERTVCQRESEDLGARKKKKTTVRAHQIFNTYICGACGALRSPTLVLDPRSDGRGMATIFAVQIWEKIDIPPTASSHRGSTSWCIHMTRARVLLYEASELEHSCRILYACISLHRGSPGPGKVLRL